MWSLKKGMKKHQPTGITISTTSNNAAKMPISATTNSVCFHASPITTLKERLTVQSEEGATNIKRYQSLLT